MTALTPEKGPTKWEGPSRAISHNCYLFFLRFSMYLEILCSSCGILIL